MGKIFKQGIVFSFVNQKGGVGKSTLTALFANYLHTEGKNSGLKVAVIDADDEQQSLYRMRQRESDNSAAYQIIQCSSVDIAENLEFYKEEYDVILLDLPGNMKQPGIITSYFLIDVAVMPFEPNMMDLDSTQLFYTLYKDQAISKRKEHGYNTIVSGVLNRVNDKVLEFKDIIASKDQLSFPLMENYVKEGRVQYQRNMSTKDYELTDSDKQFCEELISLLIKYSNENV